MTTSQQQLYIRLKKRGSIAMEIQYHFAYFLVTVTLRLLKCHGAGLD